MNRREFLQALGIAALATPTAYSFLGNGIWTPPIDIVTSSLGMDVATGRWTHVLISGYENAAHNGHFKILDDGTMERTDLKLCVGGVLNQGRPRQTLGVGDDPFQLKLIEADYT